MQKYSNLEHLGALVTSLVHEHDQNRLLVFPFNIVKLVHSEASPEEYWAILRDAKRVIPRIGLISFSLPEYLCFSGAAEETYEILVTGRGYKLATACRIDSDFAEVVFKTNGSCIQVLGSPARVREYYEQNAPSGKKYSIAFLKSLFTIGLLLPTTDDPVKDTALRRCALRFAVSGLNHLADCYRRYVGIPWASVPHYSFFSFAYGYIREYLPDGTFIEAHKYMMNPATGVLPERPRCIDPDGTFLKRFTTSLISDSHIDHELNLFRKGEAYSGHGHDLAGIRLCVSAIDAILRRWVIEKQIDLGTDKPDKARLKKLLGQFEAELKQRKLVDAPHKFIEEVKQAINLRHAMEHESLQEIDSTVLFPAIKVLRRFFEVVAKEVS